MGWVPTVFLRGGAAAEEEEDEKEEIADF